MANRKIVAVRGLRGVTEEGKILAELVNGRMVEICMLGNWAAVCKYQDTQNTAPAVYEEGILTGFVDDKAEDQEDAQEDDREV